MIRAYCRSRSGSSTMPGSLNTSLLNAIVLIGVLSSWVMLPMKSFFISLSFRWRRITHTLYAKKVNTMSVTTKGKIHIHVPVSSSHKVLRRRGKYTPK